MAKQNDIARAKLLVQKEDIKLGPKIQFVDKNNNNFPDRMERRLKVEESIIEQYSGVVDHSKSFWSRIRAFFGATTTAGRGAKAVKDFILLFTPYGEKISTVTEFITERFIKPKQKMNAMESTKEKIIRIIKQPSTKAAITGILTALGLVFGANVDAVGVASTLTESAVGVVTGLFGLYFVYRTVRNLFTDDAKETANK